MSAPSFQDVQAILNRLVKGREEDLERIHGAGFGWETRQQLAEVVVRPGGSNTFRLLDPDLVAQKRGRETFLIQALTTGAGGFSRMPQDGPYATDQDIELIVAWINAGMPA